MEEVEELGEKTMLADLGQITSNAKHLLSLINDVLDLSNIEANKMEPFTEPLNVAGFVTYTASIIHSLVGRKANTLLLDVTADIGMIRIDTVNLRHACSIC